jgi:hypothetical protein
MFESTMNVRKSANNMRAEQLSPDQTAQLIANVVQNMGVNQTHASALEANDPNASIVSSEDILRQALQICAQNQSIMSMPPLQMNQGKPPAGVNKSYGQISGLPPMNKRTNTGAPPGYLATTRTATDSQHQTIGGARSRSASNNNQPVYASAQHVPTASVSHRFGNQIQTPVSQHPRNENMPQPKSSYQTVEPRMVNNFVPPRSPNQGGHSNAFNSMQTVTSMHAPNSQMRDRSPVSNQTGGRHSSQTRGTEITYNHRHPCSVTTQPAVNDRYTAKGHPPRQHGSNFHTTTISAADYEDDMDQYYKHDEEDDIAEFADQASNFRGVQKGQGEITDHEGFSYDGEPAHHIDDSVSDMHPQNDI